MSKIKKLPLFITIPDKADGSVHYIRPHCIVRITKFSDMSSVVFVENGKTLKVNTLLTPEDIHERLQEIDAEESKMFFGGFESE